MICSTVAVGGGGSPHGCHIWVASHVVSVHGGFTPIGTETLLPSCHCVTERMKQLSYNS